MGLYRDALELWGPDLQIGMVMEECAELILAILKMGRDEETDRVVLADRMCQEAADVEIMIEQLREMGYGVVIDHHKNLKLERLASRIEKAKRRRDQQ